MVWSFGAVYGYFQIVLNFESALAAIATQEQEQEQEKEYLFDPKNVYVVYTIDTGNIIKIIIILPISVSLLPSSVMIVPKYPNDLISLKR